MAAAQGPPLPPIPQPPGPPPKRSGSGLGAQATPGTPSTGMHFGHHKSASPKKQAKRAGWAAGKKSSTAMHAKIRKHRKRRKTMSSPSGSSVVPFIPSVDAFFSQTCDIYAYNGSGPALGNARTANVNILVTGTYLEGMRQKITAADCYTHIMLLDPNIEIHDSYGGQGTQATNTQDQVAIPAGQILTWFDVRAVFVTKIGSLGRRKVVMLDRHQANFPNLPV